MTIGWRFDNTYSKLPKSFLSDTSPIPVESPQLIILNDNLTEVLGLNFSELNENDLSKLLSGNLLPDGSKAISQAYAGHQFGNFTILGDGRAVLIGEHISKKNERFDIQFKGSGKTPFSRGGDGRAALGPMLREYIISEAMHSLNIPTTRSLAVVKTGEEIIREKILKGAVLTRVASSHLRVGTFQYIASRQNDDELNILVKYTLDRHYPNIKKSKNQALELLKVLVEKQTNLVISWMRVGFIHGVMNTDNMTISGETIDYGPCAFMDIYDPKTVFSSIDQLGRYAYSNQPGITKWNLARFAECLIPLIDKNKDKAIEMATEVINDFEKNYEIKWLNMMRDKLGLFGEDSKDQSLVLDLLNWMHKNKADYTSTFCFLMNEKIKDNKIYKDQGFLVWKKRWQERLKMHNSSLEKYLKLMRTVNPLVIPRNHIVEEALAAANDNNFVPLKKLNKILNKPYINQNGIENYQGTTNTNYKDYKTFCGT
ncbi:YdiU family protein [Candidatus Pelagibacter bacterium]|nr:YdiU family protein [Candidatus Pelagibacter bacterium]